MAEPARRRWSPATRRRARRSLSVGYSEPSLVFLLGTATRLVTADAGRRPLAGAGMALVGSRDDAAFRQSWRPRADRPGARQRRGARLFGGRRQAGADPLSLGAGLNAGAVGQLYGLGVGPGDPELVTLKALRLLRAAPVVAYPAPEDGDSFARSIVAEWIGRSPARDRDPLPDAARTAAPRRSTTRPPPRSPPNSMPGDDVALLCQGDPFFYGSFIDSSPGSPGATGSTSCRACRR